MPRTRYAAASLMAAISLSALLSVQAHAQENGSGSMNEDEGEGEEIVVTGARERGSVIGDIKPEQQLDAADVRALGITSINDLLTELGPQLQSASGKPPVTLLEGKRISSFREIASLPAEAIARVDILPEEVGLRYGYGADQKVMNIVLRQRFRAFTGELTGKLPTEGGAKSGEAELGYLSIRRGERVNLNAEYSSTARLFESERGLTAVDSTARTLMPYSQQLTVNGSYHKPLTERTQATLTAELSTDLSESNAGLSLPAVTIPGGTPYATGPQDSSFLPFAPGVGPLDRSSGAQSGQIGLTVNAQRSAGQWTLTGTYVRKVTHGITERPFNLTDYAADVAAGDPAADPALPVALPYLVGRPADETYSYSDTGNIDFIYNRNILRLPAGDVAATARISGSTMQLENKRSRDLIIDGGNVRRDGGGGSLSLDFPISRASDKLGRLSANANVGVDQLSDAGTLRSFGGGLNWTPRKGIAFTASYRDEETAATPQQLGDPLLITQNVPVFDYVRGESVLVTTLSGGNRTLDSARAQNMRLGFVLTPLQDPNVVFSVDFNHSITKGGISGFPGITEETTEAFPDRFQRGPDQCDSFGQCRVGALTSVDIRPINITAQKRDSLRWGINFSKRLKTPQSQIDAMRAAAQRRFPNGMPGGPGGAGGRGNAAAADGAAAGAGQPGGGNAPPPAESGNPQGAGPGGARGANPGGPGGGFGGSGGGRGGFGGGQGGAGGGRINFAIYHDWMFTNTTQLASTLPVLDLLNGDALGSGAGPSRHQIEVQTGFSQSGYGLRLTGEWKSASQIDGTAGIPSSQLHFSDLATINLRLFANLTQMPSLVEKVPFFRGARLQLSVDNLFNERQNVTDGNGNVPFAYQPAFIDPIGRSVRLSFRKLIF